MRESFNLYSILRLLVILILTSVLSGCSVKKIGETDSVSFLKRIFDKKTYTIYRIDIQQGNELPPNKVAQLRPGLNKEQVLYLLGATVTSTLFHRNRWDYVSYMKSGKNRQRELYTVALFFNKDTLVSIEKSKFKSVKTKS